MTDTTPTTQTITIAPVGAGGFFKNIVNRVSSFGSIMGSDSETAKPSGTMSKIPKAPSMASGLAQAHRQASTTSNSEARPVSPAESESQIFPAPSAAKILPPGGRLAHGRFVRVSS